MVGVFVGMLAGGADLVERFPAREIVAAYERGKRDLTLERSLEAAVDASSAWLQRLTDSSARYRPREL